MSVFQNEQKIHVHLEALWLVSSEINPESTLTQILALTFSNHEGRNSLVATDSIEIITEIDQNAVHP